MTDVMAPLPVLLMVRELTLGGSERQMSEMAKALDPRRFQVHAGCFRPGGMRARELEAAGIPILALELRSFKSPWKVRASLGALRRYVREHGIRIIHGFDPPTSLLVGHLVPWLRPAVVLTSQRNYQQARTRLVRIGIRISHRMSAGIVVNCEAMRQHLLEDERLPPDRIHLCYNGLDTQRFQRVAIPRDGLVPDDALVVGTLCALRPEKDLGTLIEAFATCLAGEPRLFLLVVGSGPERERLEAQAAARGIAARCRFEPMVADVVPWLSLMDIFVLPSRFEALPNALMEAMSCGCACVASRVGGTPELVTDGETGLLFRSGDVPALTAQLRRLIAEPSLRARLCGGAVAKIRAGFSLEAAATRLGAIYDERLAAS
jgi:glycosyltransferase involved in cell wall biosynthesis